jgi:energy-converting hydrogenase Eha subunit A
VNAAAWNPADHLLSPDRKWYWDGVVQQWKAVPASDLGRGGAGSQHGAAGKTPATRGLDSFAGSIRSEDLAYGQSVLVWARWILIGTGLLLSFWSPTGLLTLQVQLAAIIALAFGNFYLHVQLLRGHPALDNVVYGASLADICVVTALVIVQTGYPSPVFVFYFAAIVGISVAFPTPMTAGYTALVVGVYGVICLATATTGELPAVFTRLLTLVAVAVCGNLFARHEAQRRADAIRVHQELLDEAEQKSPAAPAS